MRLLRVDKKSRELVFIPENVDDLWFTEKIIERGDVVSAIVQRRVKREGERGPGEVVRVKVDVEVEDITFHKYAKALRVKGRVRRAEPERFVGIGKYQSVEIRPGDKVRLTKAQWREWIVGKLKELEKQSRIPKILIVVLDNREAQLFRYDGRLTLLSKVENPHPKEGSLSEFFGQVARAVRSENYEVLVISGPSVLPNLFRNFLGEGEVVRVPVVGEKGAQEVLRRKLLEVMERHRYTKIWSIMDEALKRLSTGEPVAVGKVVFELEDGRIEALLVHEKVFWEMREEVMEIMERARMGGAEIHVVPEDHPRAREVLGLGGLVALLRW